MKLLKILQDLETRKKLSGQLRSYHRRFQNSRSSNFKGSSQPPLMMRFCPSIDIY
jgi:hypothetical protein